MPVDREKGKMMNYYFFVNPVAGKGKGSEKLVWKIRAAAEKAGVQPVIYQTKGVGDAERRAREIAESLCGAGPDPGFDKGSEIARFYACGGDGTVNEVVNGIAGFPGIAVGIIPTGTGNDTIRNFFSDNHSGEQGYPLYKEDFQNIEKQLAGNVVTIDLMKYRGVIDGVQRERYCVNMFNNGFDCNVVARAAELKKKPFISGSFAYLLAVFQMFVRKKGIALTVSADQREIRSGQMLLCSVSNGSFCGGGIKSSPLSSVCDEVIEINLINDVTRRKFLKLFPKFSQGKHYEMEEAKGIVEMVRCRTARLEPFGAEAFQCCVDGEIAVTTGLEIEVCPGALQMILPHSAA